MKPIELTVQGLNSFRETQHIDFEQLCADGIFGIFGPTGSGKSTILDAITLALYGTVERAANNTQGILNQLEDQLSVGFTFELVGQTIDRYRAERSYKRTKDGGLRMSSCRLLKLSGDKEVLADKEKDVTRKIRDILGLTHDDFTRAVVLPQGKFSEFLTLKGNERRKMLQRLFHLEKYGDELMAKLKLHFESACHKLEVISEKETLLGDASQEAVERLSEHSRLLNAEYSKTSAELESSGHERDQIRQIWTLQEEKNAKLKEQSELQKKQQEFEMKKNLLKMNDEAEKIIPYLENLIAAENEVHEADSEFSHADLVFSGSKNAEEKEKKAYTAAKQKREVEEPLLSARRQNYVQGMGIKRQLDAGQKEKRAATVKLSELEKKLQSGDVRINSSQKKKEELDRSMENLEKRLSEIDVPSSRRAMIQRARDAGKAIDALDDRLKEKRAEWTSVQKKMLESQQALEQVHKQQKAANEKAGRWFLQCQRIYNHAADTKQMIRLLLEFVKKKQEEYELERDRAYRLNLSLNLASELKDGDPCPVCGAVHHPHPPAVDKQSDQKSLEKKVKYYRQTEESLIRFQQENHACAIQLEEHSKKFSTVFSNIPEMSNLSDASKEFLEAGDFTEWESRGIQEVLRAIDLAVREEKQDIIASGETLENELEQAGKVGQNRISIESNLRIYSETQLRIEREAINQKNELEDLRAKWSEEFPKQEDIQNTYQIIQNDDREAESIRKTMTEFRTSRANLERRLAHDQDEHAAIEGRRNEIKGKLENIVLSLADRTRELSELHLSVDEQIGERIAELDSMLKDLKENQENHDQKWQLALTEFNETDKRRSSTSVRLERARFTLNNAEKKWDERKNNSNFLSRQAVFDAHMTDEERRDTDTEIQSYEKDKVQIASDLRTLLEKLSGKSVTADQMAKVENRYLELKESVRQLSEKRGAASKVLEDIKKRHALFNKLESERKAARTEADQFEKLLRVFRGNAFVEFVAEEQLQQVCIAASKRLGDLTHGRYTLETDDAGGFIIRDNGNGGIRRPVSSLSGGETFLTSLALALSLSEQIQLRGNVPLQFFFLDEGFGTLDPDLLDTVVTALEKLHMRKLSIGIISHVPEMRERLPRRLIVEPANPSERGSRVRMEVL
ncbi:SbcC/MukB-like Walker B domain-containing protein [Sporolactobacillus pectinivorans]|uniref:SbcC/MukB-like Walker B domain-containing protein n=1 Tax=Sporolactobacillus pectinivorans TaxID=1591408 RepID=UPI000C260889|nr:AAA family ATPase [Sporolactobacillus pectinivorans]